MVQTMGLFDEWQAQKDSQYLTLTDYITELAKAENSSIKATLLYLINHKENLKLYKKSIDGNYHKIAYDDLFDCFEDNALDDALKELLTYIEQTPYFHDFNFIGNDFSKKLYKNVYVKKVGVSRIEPVAPSEPKAGEIKPHDEPIELGEHQLLMKDYPSFTPHELACFLSDKDPDYINNNNFTDFNLSERLVYKALSNGYLSKNVNEEIKNQEAKEYLHSIGKIYKGFNDNLPPATADKIGHATITQTMPTDSQLLQQVADQQATIDQQAKKIVELKAQLASIEQASKDTQSDTPADNKLLTAIYDDSKPYLYAPELHNAIEVWKLIYHDNLTSQHLTTHSDKFESAIKRLGITFANNAPKDRLKQITTPQQQKEKTKPKNS